MEKTGLIDELFVKVERSLKAHSAFTQTKEAVGYTKSLGEELSTLKKIHAARDVVLALGCEQILLYQELKNYANSPEEVNSIGAALKQMSEAKESLAVVRDPTAYQAATRTYSGKQMEAGLPLDSFRQFLKSHSARLGNRMAAPLSVPEKNILRQRKENMSMVQELYVEMQRAALGIEAPTKSKGLVR